jgi:cytochrome c553
MRSAALGAASAVLLLALAGAPAPAFAADAKAGKTLVEGVCKVCHGVDGLAKVPDAPNLAGESAIYISNQLKAFRSGQRQHQQMSIIASGLTDEDIANVAAWFSSLKVTVEMPPD